MQKTITKKKTKEQEKNIPEFSRFSEPLKTAFQNAERAAKLAGSEDITPKFLFVGILLDPESLAFFLLDKISLDASETIKRLSGFSAERILATPLSNKKKILLSEFTKNIVLDAVRIAKEGKGYYIGTEHVLLALLRSGDPDLKFLAELSGIIQSLPNFSSEVLRATVTPFDLLKQVDSFVTAPVKPIPQVIQENGESVLSLYTEVLTSRFRKFSPFVEKNFRKKYSDEMLATLMRKGNRSILITGASGVGKSALMEELIYRFVIGDVPLSLRKKQIIKLNVPAIIAMSKFPNEVDKQVINVMNEVYGQDNLILYIEDFQSLVSSQMRGGLNLATSMKIFLENSGLTIIAALQDDEYRAFAEANRSLLRFFSIIEVEEPSQEESAQLIKDSVKEIEDAHYVKITKEAIENAVRLTSTYMSDRVLPEKAIEVIDIAASKKSFAHEYKFKHLGNLLATQAELKESKDRLVVLGDFEGAEMIRRDEKELNLHIKELQQDVKAYNKKNDAIISAADIKNIVATLTKLPISTVTNNEMSSLKNLEGSIKDSIISQEDAIRRVASAVKRGRIGITNRKRPWASLLFLGPTGVGKTELAKVLARILFGNDEERLIQIDMSEFMEQHSVSKLIGSPPGYVGFEQGGWLTDKLMENPYSVVLFDEIEKAHPEVLNILLQVLEDGHLTDSRGNKVSFQNSIIILTSNIGAEKITEDKILGFYKERATNNETLSEGDYEQMKEKLLKELKKKLRPELLNRLDDVIIFKSLSKSDAAKVLDIMLKELNNRLEELRMSVTVSDNGKKKLLEDGFSTEYGARPLRRIIQHEIEDIVADYVLENGHLEKGLSDAKAKKKDLQNLFVEYDKKQKAFKVAS